MFNMFFFDDVMCLSVYDYGFLYKFCDVILRRMCLGKYYVFFYIYWSYYILNFKDVI